MIFIFGYQPVTKSIGPVQEIECPNCHHKKHWILRSIQYTVSLFFLPILPLKREMTRNCPICNFSQQLTREEYQQASKLAALNKEAVETDMPEEEYENRLAQL
jgi:ssDNA-binding Zn-finger/Zn-ribbon topoisomerase 1